MSGSGVPAAGPVRVRVPATSANLGPGFDTAGLALARYDEVEARVTAGGIDVTVTGEGAGEVPLDSSHLVVEAAHAAFDALGTRPPGLALTCVNAIPHSRGLGSSAAAIVAGVVAARALAGVPEPVDDDALTLADRLEGHPDNVAACLFGGFTLAGRLAGETYAERLDPAGELCVLAAVPPYPQSTQQARGLLPAQVPHGDAAANAARAALLAPALTGRQGGRRRLDLLFAATEDRLHQPYRAPAMPETSALISELRADGHAAVVSGAGPTVVVLGTASSLVGARKTAERSCPGWQVWELPVDRGGTVVVPG